MRPDVDALAALLAKATPGPWHVLGAQGTALWAGDSIVAHHASPRQMHRMARADAEAVVALRNEAEALLAYVRELERERDDAALAMREKCAQACEKNAHKCLLRDVEAALVQRAAAIRGIEP